MANGISYYEINQKYREEWNKGNKISYDQARDLIKQDRLAATQPAAIQPTSGEPEDPFTLGLTTSLKYPGASLEPGSSDEIFPEGKYHDAKPDALGDSLMDVIGGALWGFGKVGTFGATDYLTRKAFGDEAVDEVLADWQDSKAGRIALMLGEAGGFLRGIGLVKGGMAKTANIGALGNTTRGLQRKAAKKLTEDINQNLLKNVNKTGVDIKDVNRFIINSTDDLVGFGNKSGLASRSKGTWDFLNPFSHSVKPYMNMRKGSSYIGQVTGQMRGSMPGKLTSYLGSKGIAASTDDIVRLSDDIINQVTKTPINNLDDMIVNRWGGKFSQIAGGVAQEAFDIAMVGTLIDAHMYANGELEPEPGQSYAGLFAKQFLHHALTGAAFGGIRVIPGGASMPIYKKVGMALDLKNTNQVLSKFGGNIKGFNKHISKVTDPKGMRAVLETTFNQNRNFVISLPNGQKLFHGSTALKSIKPGDLPTIKKAIIGQNQKWLKELRGGLTAKNPFKNEIVKDLFFSSPRWLGGAAVMNYAALNQGVFDSMDPDEAGAHFLLSTWMSKRGKPLRGKGVEGKKPAFDWSSGERPYFYNEELVEMHKNMEHLGYNMTHVKDLVKGYERGIYDTYINKHIESNGDITEVIKALERNNIIYNREEYLSKHNNEDLRASGNGDVITSELSKLITPVSGVIKARGYDFNPNMLKKNMDLAIKDIHQLKSTVLSTTDNPISLNSTERIKQSILKSTESQWNQIELDLFNNFKDMATLLTGNPNFIDKSGRMLNRITFAPDNIELTQKQARAVRQFFGLQQELEQSGLITIREKNQGKQFGTNVQEPFEKNIEALANIHDNFSSYLGREVYGQNSNERVDLTSPELWHFIGHNVFNKNVRVNYDILFNNRESLPKDVNDATVDDLTSLIDRMVSPDKSNKSAIVNDVRNLIMNESGETYKRLINEGNLGEIHDLTSMMHNLYSIMKTGKSPQGGKAQYSVSEAIELKGKLIELGMPDPSRNNGEDFRIWTEKMRNHGINEAIGGLDVSPEVSYSINRLMEGGLVAVNKGNQSLGGRLEMAREIKAVDIERLNPDMSSKEIDRMIKVYDDIVTSIPNKAVAKTDRIDKLFLTNEQLATLEAVAKTINMNKHISDSKDLHVPVQEIIMNLQEERQLLESSIKDTQGMEKTVIDRIKAKIKLASQQETLLTDWDKMYWENVMGTRGDITRSAAFYHHVKNTKIDGKTISELFLEMNQSREKLDMKTFDTISETIDLLQQEIAQRWRNRPEVFTDIEIQREESLIRHQAEELMGKLNSDNKNTISPDNFFVEYAKTGEAPMMEKVVNQIVAQGGKRKTYENATEALYDLYEISNTGIKNTNFRDAIYEISGLKQGDIPSNKLKNDTQRLFNLFERQFSVNKITLNLAGDNKSLDYSGTFDKGTISHSRFTDVFTEIFKTADLNLLSDQVLLNNKITTLRGESTGDVGLFEKLVNTLAQDRLIITQKAGATKNQKLARTGTEVEPSGDNFLTFDMTKQGTKGKQYLIGVDENINFLMPHTEFHSLAKSFKKWYEVQKNDPYVLNAINKHRGAAQLFERLGEYYKYIEGSLQDRKYSIDLFKVQSKKVPSNRLLTKALHEMFNVMYGERIDGDWLQSAYDANMSHKDFKYRRLGSNQGYARNTDKRRDFTLQLWGGDKSYIGDVVRKYSPMSFYNNLVINDAGTISEKGQVSSDYITDNRTVAERSINEQYNNNKITKEQRDGMLSRLFNSHSLNAEANNGATVVRRERLDFILINEGNSQLIGESAGHKPVGTSSFKDANGNIHVFYNKTHYFYDKKFDTFFANNPNIEQITLTSGAKKAKIIKTTDPNLINNLLAITPPKTSEATNIVDWLNNKNNFNNMDFIDGKNGVARIDANQDLIGTVYGEAKGAKVLKQLSNWSEYQKEIFIYGRADAIKNFNTVRYNLYDPSRPHEAGAWAREYLNEKTNKGNAHNPENENISLAQLWISGGGVPYSRISKNLYDNMVKSRFIDDSGVFDGFTHAGGAPILRPDFTGKLNIPVYQKIGGQEVQTILGEANVGFDFLDRTITHTGQFGKSVLKEKTAKGTIKKNKAEEISSISVAVNVRDNRLGHRDIQIDLKNGEIYDPFGIVKDLPAFYKAAPKGYNKTIGNLIDGIQLGKIVRYRDITSYLFQREGTTPANIVGVFSPAPRTGPHDLVAAKIINRPISKKDGGVVELNSYDLTLRAQRDFDTDKLPFYLDLPYNVVREAYKSNSLIKEAMPINEALKTKPSYDPYNAEDFWMHKGRIKDAGFLRGKVQKQHRKLDYAWHIFKDIGSIKFNINGQNVELVFNKSQKGLQRLTNDSQSILDPYNGTPDAVFSPEWINNTLFGNSAKFGDRKSTVTAKTDEPFFTMKVGKDNALVKEPILKEITNKILNDYGNLLTIESGVWEAGEMKTPRYQDMHTIYRQFQNDYHPKRINWNFYNYLKAANVQGVDQIFFPKGKKDASGKTIEIKNIFGNLSEAVNKLPTTFLQSLDGIAKHDMLKVNEIVNPQGDYFNQGIMKWLGRYRGEILESIRLGDDIPAVIDKTPIIDELWNGFRKNLKTEEMMIQLSNLESQLHSLESIMQRKVEQGLGETPEFTVLANDIAIKRNGLLVLRDKLMVENYGEMPGMEKITTQGKKERIIGEAAGVVRNEKTGKLIEKYPPGSKNIVIKEGEVFIKNGVQLVPVRSHDMLDAVAFARATLGYYAHIKPEHKNSFTEIVSNTRKEINESMAEIMDFKGYKDWSRHYAKVQESIDRGLRRIEEMANIDAPMDGAISQPTNVGNYPKGTETYGKDFLMALLVPKEKYKSGNNVYYNPTNNEFLPAVGNINKTVVDAVMQSLKNYNLSSNFNGFVMDLAKVHGANYKTLTAGDGFDMAARKLSTTTFEGALLNNAIERVLHDPFVTKKEYKTLKDNMQLTEAVGSQFAELYRQILQEGAMTDPITAFRLKERLIESYGQDAYDSVWKKSRGYMVFDGITTKQFGGGTGQGQLIGELLYPKGPRDIIRAPQVRRKNKDGAEVLRVIDQIGGQNNFYINKNNKGRCN
jgi:hypothetical protein